MLTCIKAFRLPMPSVSLVQVRGLAVPTTARQKPYLVMKAMQKKTFKNSLFQWLICLEQKKMSVGSIEISAFHSCSTFSSRSNCHGKWKSHHLLTPAESYPASVPEDTLHQTAQDWSQYRAGDSRRPHS